MGHENLPIETAFEKENERISTEYHKMLEDEFYDSLNYRVFSYKKRSEYFDQISRLYKNFSSKQILILSSEEMFTHPLDAVSKVFGFLEVDPGFIPQNIRPRNVGEYRGNVPTEHSFL